jgi:hypothetical protein
MTPGVRSDEEDRGGEHAHVDLEPVEKSACKPEARDDAEHRVVGIATFLRWKSEQRLELAIDLEHGQRGQRDEGEGEVDREHGKRDELVRLRNLSRRIANLLREVRHGFDPCVRQHRNGDRDEKLLPSGGYPEADVVDEDTRAQDEDEAEDDEECLRREVDDGQEDVHPSGFANADDVDADEDDDDDGADHDVSRVLPERSPEDREIVGHEERRDGDGGDVNEHLCPGSREAHELVEAVAGEAGRAAGFRITDGAFRVRGGGRREDEARDDEHERRQPEGEGGCDAEGVVDRGADVAVRRREESRRAEGALEALHPATTWRHRSSLGLVK